MRLRFADCVFDSDTREVIRNGRAVALPPKAFALLELLIESRPKAVTKSDIRARLWPDVHVTEANLGNLVVHLRAALGDNAREPRIIRTLPRFGYAFGASSTEERGDSRGRGRSAPDGRGFQYRLIWGRREIALEPGNHLIGRDREAAVWIDDDSVSRRHARVAIGETSATIEDLGSKNGTSVGDERIRKPTVLRDRDVVRIGPAVLRVRVLKRTGSTRSLTKEHRTR
jgi:DNA-binding winged helix-turn-helix (wHTH) protein